MALNKITYDNKVSLNPQPSVANINKVSDADMNEIKSVVNNNVDELENKITTTIYTGVLKGGENTTLTGVKDKLIVYARCNSSDCLVYTIDLTGTPPVNNYSAGMVVSWDTASGVEYYVSEGKYATNTGVFSHERTGYINVSTGAFTNRNNQNGYFIYKIETCD